MKQYEFWGIIILCCVFMIVIGLVVSALFGSYDVNFTMDNNTLEAVKSINWSELPK